jgi:hypothetical protein
MIGTNYRTFFDDFDVSLIKEPGVIYRLFEPDISDIQAEQARIFGSLEKDLLLLNANSFRNQVHFQLAHQAPVQRWFPYREGYSIKLVDSFIKELGIKENVFDPFCGSGTTLLSARHNRLRSFGIDVNPISVLVATVENEQYSNADLVSIASEIANLIAAPKPTESLQTRFELANKVFNKDILNALLHYKRIIQDIRRKKTRNFLMLAWLAIIEEVSNIKKEGNGIKYKNRRRTPNGYVKIEKEAWEERAFPGDKFEFVKSKLKEHLDIMLSDVRCNYGYNEFRPNIYSGSCLEFDKFFSTELEFTFFSPPYCNCFDYFEIHKVDLWLGDFVSDKEEFRRLRNSGFRSNTNSLNHKPVLYRNNNLESLISLFDSEKLWNVRLPSVVRGYFDDMYALLKKLYTQTRKDGHVGIVVGNSAYSGVIIPADILIADIAREIGFNVEKVFITRHLTTSSQQKQELEPLKSYLRESIVLLGK